MRSALFLIEHRLPGVNEAELALLQTTLSEACVRLTARGRRVQYVSSTFLPGSARLLSLFQAASANDVRAVSDSAQAPLLYVEVAIQLPAPLV